MSEENKSAAVIIKPKHQSAPKEHFADKAIKKAAEEIDAGTFVPPSEGKADLNKLGIALYQGKDIERFHRDPQMEDFDRTRTLNEIAEHPRVVEAMERMKLEIEDERDDERMLEMTYQLHEMQEAMAGKNKWDGQERWEGKDNEEMRRGQVLSPAQFLDKLYAVIGEERVLRGAYMQTNREGAGRAALVIRNPMWKGDSPADLPYAQARTLREEAEKDMLAVKGLRKLGRDGEADRIAALAREKILNSGGLMMEARERDDDAPKEFIRVATLQFPASTEWMIMGFDEFGVPTEPRFLGWRTALLTMIRRRVITEDEAHTAFPVGSGPAAGWYLEQLQAFRNTGMGMVN